MAGDRPVPWTRVVAIAAGAILAAVFGFIGWTAVQREREAKAAAAAELAAADRARAEQIRAESKAERDVADPARAARREARLDAALKELASDHPAAQCDAALLLGRLGSKEHVAPLVKTLNTSTYKSARGCAASALVDLGETAAAMAAFTEWANGDDPDLRLSAIAGFGQVGPSAAGVALPYFTEALKSPYMNVRYVAVDSLAKLGPAAVPLLQVASGDADKDVRALATSALNAATARKQER
jgi:hypothetical protein